MLIPLGFWAASGAGSGGADIAYELISTTIFGSNTASVTFSSLPTTYKHLQLRVVTRSTVSGSGADAVITFNSDTAANYNNHALFATGAGVTVAANTNSASIPSGAASLGGTNTANIFATGIIDILNAFNTTTYKTVRSFSGHKGSTLDRIYLASGAWRNTAAISSITLTTTGTLFTTGSRFSLYGIKG